jgi:hypothetical protein
MGVRMIVSTLQSMTGEFGMSNHERARKSTKEDKERDGGEGGWFASVPAHFRRCRITTMVSDVES